MYKDIIKGWTKHADFMLIDIVCLEVSFLIAYMFRQGVSNGRMPELYRTLMLMIIVSDICVVFFLNSYTDIIKRGYLIELKQVLLHCAWVVVAIIVWLFFIKQSSAYSRIIIVLMYPISVCIVYPVRLFWKRVIRLRRKYRKDLRKIMVITTDSQAEELVKGLLVPYRDYKVEAIVVYDNAKRIGEKICGVPVVADKSGILVYIQQNIIDEIFIDLKGYEDEAERLMDLFVGMGLVAHMNLISIGVGMKNRKVNLLGKYTVLSSSMKVAAFRQIFFKRLMDICGGLVGLVFAGIALIIFGPIIYHQSPGPIFFMQKRVARNGRTFRLYKFRTMYLDAEERKAELMKQNKMQGFMFKMDNDPRIIPIGHFMRKTSIDELPQFWNILKGDMSLVGTRPPTVDEYKQYEVSHRRRLAMKPGLTGMWQVSGRSDIVDFEKVVALDAQYIENWNLSMDIKILWKTVKIVLAGEGAV